MHRIAMLRALDVRVRPLVAETRVGMGCKEQKSLVELRNEAAKLKAVIDSRTQCDETT